MSKTDTSVLERHSQSATTVETFTNSDSIYRIAVRFGDRILEAGFTLVPNLVLNHYAELRITPAEMLRVFTLSYLKVRAP